MNLSMMRRMTDREVLNSLDEKRSQSPVIDDLCRRLEECMGQQLPEDTQFDCPVCMASLEASAMVHGDGIAVRTLP